MSVLSRVLIGMVWFYQRVLSRVLHTLTGPGSGCRFEPTCSDYMATALRRFGAVRGTVFGLRRMCRCHPWGGVGYDPVPEEGPERGFGAKKRVGFGAGAASD